MKTFSDYINEKQNFIFGGKAGLTGKEYGAHTSFENLEPGDKLYMYEFDDKLIETKLVKEYTVTSSLKYDNGKFRIRMQNAAMKNCNAGIDKNRINDSIDVSSGSFCYYAYSTYDDEEDVLERTKLYVKEGKYNKI